MVEVDRTVTNFEQKECMVKTSSNLLNFKPGYLGKKTIPRKVSRLSRILLAIALPEVLNHFFGGGGSL